MKKETLEKRISANLLTKTGTVKVKYYPVINLLKNPTLILRPTHWRSLRGFKRMSVSDMSLDIKEGLTLLKIDFEEGNDATRGGIEGNYIKLTKKGQQQVRDYARSFTS